ncbi:MAG: hypothetical protein JWP51_1518 [Bradyrhizobium sp.]|nr:hypothetical protein [Bradyrhizobium sp.]
MSISSISSVSAAPPVKPPDAGAPKAPDVQPDADANASQPVVQAALPPGQGTRVNQLV